jgi:hypothetical protein
MVMSRRRSASTPAEFPVLARPQTAALPNSHFWTWDHSTNWMLDDPGMQISGCYNRYYKKPETFVEDYRRLTDFTAGLGLKGIIIWGFLRDSHGGIKAARQVAEYAAQRGVAILPGFGTTWYGGAYYEGKSPYSLRTFLAKHPDAHMLDETGKPIGYAGDGGACLAHPAYQKWLKRSIEWLFREFPIGGFNLENGDFLVDYHPLTRRLRETEWPADDPEVFAHQGLSYNQALSVIRDRLPSILATYATYSGFQSTSKLLQNTGLGQRPPAFLTRLPTQAVCQWTLTGMVRSEPLPLTAFLDDGAPASVYENPNWPKGLKAPAPRNVGFLHQSSQWVGPYTNRYTCMVSTIKEACLRGFESGLEGVIIHGEVSARCIPYALNYLAFSHFSYWPQDSLRDFGRKTLSQILGSEQAGEDFAVILAHWDAGTLTDDLVKLADPSRHGLGVNLQADAAKTVGEFQRYRFWEWLCWVAGTHQPRTVSTPFPL